LVDPLAEFDWPEGAEPADTAPTPAASGFAAAERAGRGLWNAADRATAPDAADRATAPDATDRAAASAAGRRAPSASPDDETADAIVAASWGLPDEDEAAPAGRRATIPDGGASGGGRGRRVNDRGGAGAVGSGGPSGAGGGRRADSGGGAGAVGSGGGRSGAGGGRRADIGDRGGWRGQRLTGAGLPERSRTPQEEAEVARQICLRQLAVRPRTRAELATALTTRGISAETTADVLDRYDEVGIIDDAAFARAWVSSRHHGRGLARRALANELRRKGVDADTAGMALDDLDESTEAETARRLVDRKLRSTRGTPEQVFGRLVGMLARKGYPPRVAIRVAKDALAARSDDAAEFAEQIDTDALAEVQAGLEDEERARADD
jgi:regulatory protein